MRETLRKLVHLLFGLGIAGLVIVIPRSLMIDLLAISIFCGLVLSELISRGYGIPFISRFVKFLDREDALPGRGALYFAISSLVCLILFPVAVVIPAIIALAILDGVATIAGRRFGKTRIWNGKTLEGTVMAMAVTFVCLLPFLPPPGAGVATVVAGVVELVSPIDDNLTIPVSVCVVLTLIPGLI
jgi:dolichol kinase